jgi:YD repeat-containing protein
MRSSSSQSLGVDNPSVSLTTLLGNGNWTTKTTNPDGSYSIASYIGGLMDISENFDSNNNPIASSSIRDSSNTPLSGYDDWNRPTHQRDSRTGVSTTAYLSDTADIVKSVTDPGNRTTAFIYDIRGRRTEVDAPDTFDPAGAANNTAFDNKTTTSYNPDSTVLEVSGAQTYRTTHTYDYADRQISMTTYGTETATTTWIYSPTRGFLIEKKYHGEIDDSTTDADYTYTLAGRLLTRKWERGITTTYGYDDGGRLTTTDYSDNTPDITVTYDALNRQLTQSNGLAKSTFAYDSNTLRIDTETIAYDLDTGTPGFEFTRVLDRSQDVLGRPTGFDLKNGTTTQAVTSYGFDPDTGRLASVGDGTDAFDYDSFGQVVSADHAIPGRAFGWRGHGNGLAFRMRSMASCFRS